jgi:NTP pyrophosphatase (non-canonical NTP hydrolase)
MSSSTLFLKPHPTLHDIQQYVLDLEKERGFTKHSTLEQCLLLMEEIGELAKCVRKSATTMGTDVAKRYDFDAAGEFADVLIVLCAVANRLDVDLEQALRDKEEENKKREWR